MFINFTQFKQRLEHSAMQDALFKRQTTVRKRDSERVDKEMARESGREREDNKE
jgi:hypothetical protein